MLFVCCFGKQYSVKFIYLLDLGTTASNSLNKALPIFNNYFSFGYNVEHDSSSFSY